MWYKPQLLLPKVLQGNHYMQPQIGGLAWPGTASQRVRLGVLHQHQEQDDSEGQLGMAEHKVT